MAENRTEPTDASVEDYFASRARASAQRREDCQELVANVKAASDEHLALPSVLGPHRTSKACPYFERLADLDMGVLERLVAGSVGEVRWRYG